MISMLSSSQVKHCHVAHGQGYSQGNCVTCVWWGGEGLLSGFRHSLVGYCLSLNKREGVYVVVDCSNVIDGGVSAH